MNPMFKRVISTFVLASALMLGGQAMAQSTQDMSLLTEQERLAFRERLQLTTTSAGRSKVTAEMNRLVQERRMDLASEKRNSLQKTHNPAK